jgi:hypothetical protein
MVALSYKKRKPFYCASDFKVKKQNALKRYKNGLKVVALWRFCCPPLSISISHRREIVMKHRIVKSKCSNKVHCRLHKMLLRCVLPQNNLLLVQTTLSLNMTQMFTNADRVLGTHEYFYA